MSSGTGFSGFASFLDFSHRLTFFRAQLVLPLVFSGINPLANSDSCSSEESLKRDDSLEAIGRRGWSLLELGRSCSG